MCKTYIITGHFIGVAAADRCAHVISDCLNLAARNRDRTAIGQASSTDSRCKTTGRRRCYISAMDGDGSAVTFLAAADPGAAAADPGIVAANRGYSTTPDLDGAAVTFLAAANTSCISSASRGYSAAIDNGCAAIAALTVSITAADPGAVFSAFWYPP